MEYYLPKQVSVGGGNLVLKSEPMEYDGHNYISGWVDSANKFSTTFGRWEIRAKLPYGQGLWPAHVSCKGAVCWRSFGRSRSFVVIPVDDARL